MSMRPSDDPDASLHDPAFDAAWRAMSSEDPPPAKDAAILAAARRAVDAGPRRVAEATRPARWWGPVAAAATIGAIAIGILQLAAPDKTGAPATPGIVTDMPVLPEQTPKVDALSRADRQPLARIDAEADVPAAAKDARKPAAPEQGAATSAKAPATPPRPAASPAPAPMARQSVTAESAPAGTGAVTAPSAAQPFPAANMQRRETTSGEMRALPPSLGKLAADAPADATAATAQPSHGPLPVAEWISLIRKLRADGRTEEAAKELAAFRLAHPDEARQLPDDLRDWHPPDK